MASGNPKVPDFYSNGKRLYESIAVWRFVAILSKSLHREIREHSRFRQFTE